MTTRPPHPPSPQGRIADLWRRGKLTLRYHGPKELAFRVVTAPLRPTPLGRRLGHGRRYGAEESRARRWYREEGRPVTVVIPTYGDPALVEQAVASIRKTTDRGRVRIVVVDDGSAPEHQARLRSLRGARVEVAEQNAGFAATVNRGLRLAPTTDDVVVLNSDIVAQRGWLERLQYTAHRERRIGIVGPKLLYADQRIQSAGSYRNLGAPEWFDHRYRFKDTTHPEANLIAPVLGDDRRVHVHQARRARRDRRVRRALRHGLRGHGLLPARLARRAGARTTRRAPRSCTWSRRPARPSPAPASSTPSATSGSSGAGSSTSARCGPRTGGCGWST